MSDKGRTPSKLLVFALALPVFALVYGTTFASRLWAVLRPAVAAFLGVTVIGSVYAGEAYRRAPATPMRAGVTLALAVALIAPAVAPAPAAAADPAEAVIAAARQYVGQPFRLGQEGPRLFDCSGLVFRAFADAGQLPRIGGMRLRAAGYMQYFKSRGRFTTKVSEAQRGDLVIYGGGKHIGIYLGGGRVISALINPWGVKVHSLHGIHMPFTYFLQVNWGGGDANAPTPGNGKGNNGKSNNNPPDRDKPSKPNKPNKPGNPDNNGNNGNNGNNDNNGETAKPDNNPSASSGNGSGRDYGNATATGTMNLRLAADPDARIIGWVGRNSSFKVIGEGTSPAGYPWYQVTTLSGKTGWVYSRWVSLK